METFSALLTICAGNSPVPGEFPTQRPVTRNFDVFFDLHPDKRLSKQWWGWWFETPSSPLWRHCNGLIQLVRNLLIAKLWFLHNFHMFSDIQWSDMSFHFLASELMALLIVSITFLYPNINGGFTIPSLNLMHQCGIKFHRFAWV